MIYKNKKFTCFVIVFVFQAFGILVRDIYAFYPLLIKYVDLHRSTWLKNPTIAAEEMFTFIADIFLLWSKSVVSIRLVSVLGDLLSKFQYLDIISLYRKFVLYLAAKCLRL